jgi:monofunctional biosynthetic peptidoglycan transglycosylase
VTTWPRAQLKVWLKKSKKNKVLSALRALGLALAAMWLLAAMTLVGLRWIDPPTTAVHVQRRVQSWFSPKPYELRYHFVPLTEISPDMQHAVIAAEDGRFYQHHGFDWHEIRIAAEEDREGERTRGASTLTQQLVKKISSSARADRYCARRLKPDWCPWRR